MLRSNFYFVFLLASALSISIIGAIRPENHRISKRSYMKEVAQSESSSGSSSEEEKPNSMTKNMRHGVIINDASSLLNNNDDDGESMILKGLLEKHHKPISESDGHKKEMGHHGSHVLNEASSPKKPTNNKEPKKEAPAQVVVVPQKSKPFTPKKLQIPRQAPDEPAPPADAPAAENGEAMPEFCREAGQKCRKHAQCCEGLDCNWRYMQCR